MGFVRVRKCGLCLRDTLFWHEGLRWVYDRVLVFGLSEA